MTVPVTLLVLGLPAHLYVSLLAVPGITAVGLAVEALHLAVTAQTGVDSDGGGGSSGGPPPHDAATVAAFSEEVASGVTRLALILAAILIVCVACVAEVRTVRVRRCTFFLRCPWRQLAARTCTISAPGGVVRNH
jgi:hypothetical protein